MVGPDAAKQYTGVNHIAALVKEWLQSRPFRRVQIPIRRFFKAANPA
jgi:hypothetical protein